MMLPQFHIFSLSRPTETREIKRVFRRKNRGFPYQAGFFRWSDSVMIHKNISWQRYPDLYHWNWLDILLHTTLKGDRKVNSGIPILTLERCWLSLAP